jgi:hypothetical protein
MLLIDGIFNSLRLFYLFSSCYPALLKVGKINASLKLPTLHLWIIGVIRLVSDASLERRTVAKLCRSSLKRFMMHNTIRSVQSIFPDTT